MFETTEASRGRALKITIQPFTSSRSPAYIPCLDVASNWPGFTLSTFAVTDEKRGPASQVISVAVMLMARTLSLTRQGIHAFIATQLRRARSLHRRITMNDSMLQAFILYYGSRDVESDLDI